MTNIKRLIILLFSLCLCSTACTLPIPDPSGASSPTDADIDPEASIVPDSNLDEEEEVILSDLELAFTYKYADTIKTSNQFDYVEVVDEDHNALKESLANWFTNELNYDETIKLMDEEAKLSDEYYSLYSKIDINRMDNKVLSLFETCEIYSGGVHPNTGYNSVNFDITNGEILTLSTIINDLDSFKKAAAEYILNIIDNTNYYIFDSAKDTINEFSEDTFEWTLSPSGLEIHYATYTLSDYASGPLHVTLPYDEFKEYMKPEYFEISGNCICSKPDLYSNQSILLPTKDGSLTVNTNMDYRAEYDWEYTISVGTDSETVSNAARVISLNFIRSNDIWFAILVIDGASADYQTMVYRLTENGIENTDCIDAQFVKGNISVNKYTLYTTINLLGTYSMEKEYCIKDNGQLSTENELYTLVPTDYISDLVTKKELSVTIDGKDETLPIGSTVQMYQTDGESKVYLHVIDTGKIAELEVEKNENGYSYIINGSSEYDYFESLPYAG